MNDSVTANDKNIAVLTHLAGIFFSFVPALVVWILKKDDSAFIGTQAREALNFQITVVIAYMAAGVLAWILVGLLFFPIIWVGNLVLCLVAAIKVSKGEDYQYPLALRLIN